MSVEKKLAALGLEVPDLEAHYGVNPSGAHFISHYAVPPVLYLSGTVPMKDGERYMTGVLGAGLTVEEGYEAARYAALTSLSAIQFALGDLERVAQMLQLIGYVNSAPGFTEQPRVINGATDLLVGLFGDRGKPTRAAIGCQGLAGNHSVEIVLSLVYAGEEIRPPLARDHKVA